MKFVGGKWREGKGLIGKGEKRMIREGRENAGGEGKGEGLASLPIHIHHITIVIQARYCNFKKSERYLLHMSRLPFHDILPVWVSAGLYGFLLAPITYMIDKNGNIAWNIPRNTCHTLCHSLL